MNKRTVILGSLLIAVVSLSVLTYRTVYINGCCGLRLKQLKSKELQATPLVHRHRLRPNILVKNLHLNNSSKVILPKSSVLNNGAGAISLITPSNFQGTPKPNRTQSYLLSLVYEEQFTNAFTHYNELIHLATMWNFIAVEPFVRNSRLFGFQTLPPGSHSIRKLLDMDSFTEQYSSCMGAITSNVIESPDSFLLRSYRKIVVVYFGQPMFTLFPNRQVPDSISQSMRGVFKKNSPQMIVKCRKAANNILIPTVEKVLQREQSAQLMNSNEQRKEAFSIQEVFCVNPEGPISVMEIMNKVVGYIDSTDLEASILFMSWQGKFTRPGGFTDLKKLYRCVLPPTQIPYSSKVKIFTSDFIQSKKLEFNKYIALHIRFGKMLEFASKKRNKGNELSYLNCCIKRLQLLLEIISERTQVPLNQTLFMSDIGTHGSDLCFFQGHYHRCEEAKAEIRKLLSTLPVNTSEFNPEDFEGASWDNNDGFVSLVEQASMVEGRVLVVVGGGRFQGTITSKFVARHSSDSHSAENLYYQICTPPKEKLNNLVINHPNC